MWRIGFLANTNPQDNVAQLEAFRADLRQHGYVDGRNILIEYHWAEGSFDRRPDLASDMVQSGVDLIVAWGTTAVAAAKKATSTIPI